MWRQFFIFSITLMSCFAIPKSSSKRELQRLARLPITEAPLALSFDRTSGFVVFLNESAATLAATDILREAKGTPQDAERHLRAARILMRGHDIAGSIRNFGRANE